MQHLTPRQPKDLFTPSTAVHNMGAHVQVSKIKKKESLSIKEIFTYFII